MSTLRFLCVVLCCVALRCFFMVYILQALAQYNINSTDEGIIANPDGSCTIIAPRILRGHKNMSIYYGSHDAACVLFGFDEHLSGPVDYSDETFANIVSLSSNGNYSSTTSGYILKEITCINKEEHEKAGKADEIIENPDGSASFINPKILHGNDVYDIYYSAPGACSLFGYEEYLKDTAEYESSSDYAISLKSDGTFSSTTSGDKMTAISCYSGQVRNVGAAGSKIYYHKANSNLSSLHDKGISNYQLD